MAKNLKKLLGDGLAGLDKSHGTDTLYEVLVDIVTQMNAQSAAFNTLKAEYDAETVASHTDSAAADVVNLITVE